jgi:hypothetical protein
MSFLRFTHLKPFFSRIPGVNGADGLQGDFGLNAIRYEKGLPGPKIS